MASEYNELNNALNTLTTTLNGIAERNQRNKYNQQVLDMSKDMQAWSKDFNERQFAESQRQWQDSFNFNVGAAELAQANFENATQIRANDMSKAGLNPLNLVGGAEGTSANFMSGSSPAGSASSSVPSPLAPFSVADLISKFAAMNHDSSENRKNRESAEKIASIQAKSAQNVAQINSEASKYGSDLGYQSSSNRVDADRVIALQQKEIRQAELDERKYEYDLDIEKAFRLKKMELDHDRTIELVRQKSENARAIASLNVETFKAASNAFNGALHTSAYFAIGMANLRQAYEELEYAKTRDARDRAQRNFDAMLDSQTKVFSSITGLAGDVCRGFIIGNVAGRR